MRDEIKRYARAYLEASLAIVSREDAFEGALRATVLRFQDECPGEEDWIQDIAYDTLTDALYA